MRKKKQNKFGAFVIILVLVIVLILLIIFSGGSGNNTNLSLSEKRWIENNKKGVINVSVANNISIYSSNGKGIFHNFIEYIEDKTGLSFYMIPYNSKNDMQENDFYFEVLSNDEASKIKNNDMIFYSDYFVLIGKDEDKYSYPEELSNKKIGVLKDNLSDVSYYLSSATGISYSNYDDNDSMQNALKNGDVNYIAVPRLKYLTYILENKYHIVYNLTEVKEYCVLRSSNEIDKNLKSIVYKSYLDYKNENLENDYNTLLINLLAEKNSISEKLKSDFLSKKYVFGYIENPPYTDNLNGDLIGLDAKYINSFSDLTDTTFSYKKFNNVKDLSNALSSGEVDLAPNYYNFSSLKGSYKKLDFLYKDKYVILSNTKNLVINSSKSLNGKTVYGLNSALLKGLANESGAIPKTYDKINNLLSKIDRNSIIVLENSVYEMYKSNELANYRVIYSSDCISNMGYIVGNNSENEVFITLMSEYMEIVNYKQLYNMAWSDYKKDSRKIDNSIIYIFAAIIILIVLWLVLKKKISVKKKVKRDEVVRYVDPLTSLKNRNYLNKNFSKWENNSVYPQAVIIINLNNLRHVNDVYGHEEGDNLIRLAANVLIKNQLEQSDIIRTDGNEYLIYMIGYEKNKVVSYMRKLYKELGELPYGYGATMGYSMIEDDIKTIDDAINEAVLEIKANKEMKNK